MEWLPVTPVVWRAGTLPHPLCNVAPSPCSSVSILTSPLVSALFLPLPFVSSSCLSFWLLWFMSFWRQPRNLRLSPMSKSMLLWWRAVVTKECPFVILFTTNTKQLFLVPFLLRTLLVSQRCDPPNHRLRPPHFTASRIFDHLHLLSLPEIQNGMEVPRLHITIPFLSHRHLLHVNIILLRIILE